MRTIVVVIGTLLIAGVLVWMYLARRGRAAEPLIRFCIPLSAPTQLDAAALASTFEGQWGAKVSCDENPEWADPSIQMRKYLFTDGKNRVLISAGGTPLPREMVTVTAQGSTHITEQQESALLDHKAYFMVEYVTGPQDSVERVRFSTEVLLTLLKTFPATGYVNVAAQKYSPKATAGAFLDRKSLEPPDLFLLCTCVQSVDEGQRTWMHTHGMQQFGLPDMEVKFRDKGNAAYYHDLIANAAVYVIDRGPVMKPGDTAELAGDGIIYKIKSSEGESKDHFGRYGGLEIVRRPE